MKIELTLTADDLKAVLAERLKAMFTAEFAETEITIDYGRVSAVCKDAAEIERERGAEKRIEAWRADQEAKKAAKEAEPTQAAARAAF